MYFQTLHILMTAVGETDDWLKSIYCSELTQEVIEEFK